MGVGKVDKQHFFETNKTCGFLKNKKNVKNRLLCLTRKGKSPRKKRENKKVKKMGFSYKNVENPNLFTITFLFE